MTLPRLTWRSALVLYAGVTLLYVWPLVPVLGSALPHDAGDPGLNAWILWWNAHAVPLTSAWWNAPMFYPVRGAFALSETLLGLTPLTTPLQWAGATPVLAYNVAFLLSFPAAAVGAHALVYQMTRRHDAALIAGLAYGFSPYRTAQLAHLQVLWSCWMPLTLFFLYRFLESGRRRELGLAAAAWLLNGLTNGYFLVFFTVLMALWVIWFVRSARRQAAIAAVLGVAVLPLVPLLLGYHHYQAQLGLTRNPFEIQFFSADLLAIWAASRETLLGHLWTFAPKPEGELYPGLAVLTLAVLGAVAAWRAQPKPPHRRISLRLAGLGALAAAVAVVIWATGGLDVVVLGVHVTARRLERPATVALILFVAAIACDARIVQAWRRRSTTFFYAAAAAMMFLLAMGPVAHVSGVSVITGAPYWWLMQMPGGEALRVPARFGMLVMLCLSISAALAFARFNRRGLHPVLVAGILALLVFDGWTPRLTTASLPAPIALDGLARGLPVLELPVGDVYVETAALLRATAHGHPLINGFSGYYPPHYDFLKQALADPDAGVFHALEQFGPLAVVVDRPRDAGHVIENTMDGLPQARLVTRGPRAAVYALPGRVAPPPPAGGDQPLAIASIWATTEPLHVAAMSDGVLTTRWESNGHQKPNDRVVVSLARPATISRVELDLGAFHNDYPRGLRVGVDGVTRLAMTAPDVAAAEALGALDDPQRNPLVIRLPAGTTGQRIDLTVLSGHKVFSWSIVELRVYGRTETGAGRAR